MPVDKPIDPDEAICYKETDRIISGTFRAYGKPYKISHLVQLKPNAFLEDSTLIVDTKDPENINCPPLKITFTSLADEIAYDIVYRDPESWFPNDRAQGSDNHIDIETLEIGLGGARIFHHKIIHSPREIPLATLAR